MLFDCHTHTQFAAFSKDYKEVIDRALKKDIYIVNVGSQKDNSKRAIEVAHEYEKGVYAAVGLHPTHTSASYHDKQELCGGEEIKSFTSREEEFDYEYYLSLAKDEKVVAIGECGLEYFRMEGDSKEKVQKQKKAFELQIKLAKEVDKVLMLHCRPRKGTDDSYEDMYEMLKPYPEIDKILHFYVGSVEMTKRFLAAGYYFEFGGVITFTHDYDEQIKLIPIDRILTETDAPYVSPEPYRGKRNEPVYIEEVAKRLAEIKGVSYTEISSAITKTAKKVFKI